jgi:hypothetical protein
MTNDQERRATRLWCALDKLIKEIDECRAVIGRTKANGDSFAFGFTMGQVVQALATARDKAGVVLNQETEK